MKVWVRTGEYWSLVCDYSTRLAWSDGPRFTNGFHSRSLGRLLQSIMMNQSLFKHDGSPNSNGALLIEAPSAEDSTFATQRIADAFQSAP